MKLTTRRSRRTAIGAIAAVGLAALATGIGVGPASAAAVAGTLSASSGPSAGGNTLTMTTTVAKFFTGTLVSFQYKTLTTTTCTAAYSAAVAVTASAGVVLATPKILSSTKIAITVPSTVALQGSATSANWLVCVYPGSNTTTSLLSANAAYSIAAKPTLAVSPIAPASGPALGGGSVTVTGTNFITGLTAKIGSVALTGVTVVSGTTFTATVPPQAAGSAMSLSVTTTGGTATKAAAYTYTNGIIVTPNTTPTSTAATDLDIAGVGFSGLDFAGAVSGNTYKTDGTAPDDAGAHVYIVQGDYDPADNSSAKTLAQAGECVNVLVVSDIELICTLNTLHNNNQGSDSAIGNGVYSIVVVNDGQIDADTDNVDYSESIISSGSTFTVAPY
jgi:F0F1-type ATP synthase membrane subunit c/vacuolar-type H+-ATPase subunit K